MEYRGPQQADYDNVRALNSAFLILLRNPKHSANLLGGLPPALRERNARLTALQCERLASAPFLLFSFREHDGPFWEHILRARHSGNLFADVETDVDLSRLIAAGLGYLWQLARRNAYAARILCCASLNWCEQLAERPLLDIVSAASCRDILTLRAETDASLWHKLLYVATSSERPVRTAARISALQRVLTTTLPQRVSQPARAARSIDSLPLRVAEDIER